MWAEPPPGPAPVGGPAANYGSGISQLGLALGNFSGTENSLYIQTPRLAILQESWQILLYVVEDYRSKDFTLA